MTERPAPVRIRESPAPPPARLPTPAPPDGEQRRRALEHRVAELERELAEMRAHEAAWSAERGRLLAALEAAEREVVDLPALRHQAEITSDTAYWLAVVQSSWSWRLTRPLRAATRLGSLLRRRVRSR
jgi:Tfp pilus assembly protein FimV